MPAVRRLQESCIILTTTGDRAEADRIAAQLVERCLAACVQVMSIQSTYRWQGSLRVNVGWDLVHILCQSLKGI